MKKTKQFAGPVIGRQPVTVYIYSLSDYFYYCAK